VLRTRGAFPGQCLRPRCFCPELAVTRNPEMAVNA
jgi:hypothetical protein